MVRCLVDLRLFDTADQTDATHRIDVVPVELTRLKHFDANLNGHVSGRRRSRAGLT
jgi:hypothetical protein